MKLSHKPSSILCSFLMFFLRRRKKSQPSVQLKTIYSKQKKEEIERHHTRIIIAQHNKLTISILNVMSTNKARRSERNTWLFKWKIHENFMLKLMFLSHTFTYTRWVCFSFQIHISLAPCPPMRIINVLINNYNSVLRWNYFWVQVCKKLTPYKLNSGTSGLNLA